VPFEAIEHLFGNGEHHHLTLRRFVSDLPAMMEHPEDKDKHRWYVEQPLLVTAPWRGYPNPLNVEAKAGCRSDGTQPD
jgi:hypothetical protein